MLNNRWPLAAHVLLTISLTVSVFVHPVVGEGLIDRLQKHGETVSSFQAEFTQEKVLAMFNQPVIFKGRLTIVRPDKLRWEFTSPTVSALIFAGDRGMRCDEQGMNSSFDLRSDPVMRIVAEQLWLWLGGDYNRLGEKYELIETGSTTLQVQPKQDGVKEYIDRVVIRFDEQTLQPELVEILETGGDSTRIHFTSYRINGEFSSRLFSDCLSND